jgi:hypothetical protein
MPFPALLRCAAPLFVIGTVQMSFGLEDLGGLPV